jgi:hypothetical protein
MLRPLRAGRRFLDDRGEESRCDDSVSTDDTGPPPDRRQAVSTTNVLNKNGRSDRTGVSPCREATIKTRAIDFSPGEDVPSTELHEVDLRARSGCDT